MMQNDSTHIYTLDELLDFVNIDSQTAYESGNKDFQFKKRKYFLSLNKYSATCIIHKSLLLTICLV